mgnify:CR=1 FL=1
MTLFIPKLQVFDYVFVRMDCRLHFFFYIVKLRLVLRCLFFLDFKLLKLVVEIMLYKFKLKHDITDRILLVL